MTTVINDPEILTDDNANEVDDAPDNYVDDIDYGDDDEEPITIDTAPQEVLYEYLPWVKERLNWPKSQIPRPYQVDGALWFQDQKRAMIFDQPGLGKTLQGSLALTVPAIISCPGYLVHQWCDFLELEYPQWRIARIHGALSRAKRQELLDDPEYDVYVLNHEMWALRREPYKGGPEPKRSDPDYSYSRWWDWKESKAAHKSSAPTITYNWPKVETIIIDESHHFRNRKASQSLGLFAQTRNTPNVFLLTATPQYKDVRDWWHQLHIMDPDKYSAYWRWCDKYVRFSGENNSIVKVYSYMVKELQAEIGKLAIGRTYDDVGLYLPDIIEMPVRIDWHPDLYKHYKSLRDKYAILTNNGKEIDFDPMSVLRVLRILTANPQKTDLVKQIIEDTPGDEPIICFCWYRDTANELRNDLAEVTTSRYISGLYSQKERVEFADETSSRVKCVTMSSMSEGVDWSNASTVIFYELDYVPGKVYQALSRVRRFSTTGKREPIRVYYPMLKNSVDEAVFEAYNERHGDAKRVLRRALK